MAENNVAGMLKQFQKDYGDKVGSYGGDYSEATRIPTGFFAFDMATGGGIPRGRCSIIYGPESSGKTNLALRSVANHQRMYTKLTCVYVDLENSFDPKWAEAMGVDTKKLVVIRPDYAEQVVDIVEALLHTSDVGLVVVDSLAAMVTTQETNNSAEKAVVGGAGLVIGKLVRKTTLALSRADKEGRSPTLIYINQIRFKVGVMFGDPETMPGGKAPGYQASLIVRTYGKNIMDSKVNKVMPVRKQTQFVVKKWKVPIIATHGMYEMACYEHNGMGIGQTDDWKTMSGYAEQYGLIEKADKGYKVADKTYNTQKALKEGVLSDPELYAGMKQLVIERALAGGELLTESEGSEELPDEPISDA